MTTLEQKQKTKNVAEIPMKQWRIEQAQRLNITEACFRTMLYTRKYPYPKVRRVNKMVVFVKV